jgi:hypothetical protein
MDIGQARQKFTIFAVDPPERFSISWPRLKMPAKFKTKENYE